MDSGNPMPPELSSILEEARAGAPSPGSDMSARVLERVQRSVANGTGDASPSDGGAAGASALGAITKAGLALLLVLGGAYAGWKIAGSDAPREPESPVAAAHERHLEEVPPTAPAPAETPQIFVVPEEVAPKPSPPAANLEPGSERVHNVHKKKVRRQGPRRTDAPEGLDSLALEEALVEQARAVLRDNPVDALSNLAEHKRRFPKGQLSEERELLRARAFLSLGDSAAARRVATQFLKAYPRSASRGEMEEIWKNE